jgi:phage shock protein PspC (stress-responsive transcriptional regulator)
MARFPTPSFSQADKALKQLGFDVLARLLLITEHRVLPGSSNMSAQQIRTPLPLRSHTILGVCEALGEDFGFNPVWLRVTLAAMVLWSPTLAFGIYFGLGAVVLASRLLFPVPNADASEAAEPSRVREAANSQAEQRSAA